MPIEQRYAILREPEPSFEEEKERNARKMGKAWRWQTQRLHDKDAGVEGNCTTVALASLLAMPVSHVPDFITLYPDAGEFWFAIERWVAEQGYHLQMMRKEFAPRTLYLASGPSPRDAELSHMVVMQDGKLYHDPHPSGAGITEVKHVWILLPTDPGKLRIF
ncbi:hypothetical protein HOU03_gp094 [Caulobacter phage CcrSC]|uniref:Uncharacterized protein n=1 Tax=Caulobacter phage CcrSC TaxID=2283272 RepID=A0A385EDA9_9CAUD|nr:hypothetical protein HOU03_gp094 [Caulobacter phage CcrSC]AXQ69676.1 hypothetical protein CcrSC_gp094 [Caulobacter phage CcrSC]